MINMSSLLDHIDPTEYPGLREWLDRHPELISMDEKALLLLVLYKLEGQQRALNEIQLDTKTHWTN